MDASAKVLAGRNALIIGGGGGGIGRAITRGLAGAGCAVAVADADGERAEEAAAEIVAAGGTSVALSATCERATTSTASCGARPRSWVPSTFS